MDYHPLNINGCNIKKKAVSEQPRCYGDVDGSNWLGCSVNS